MIFVFKQKTAYEVRISDWSSDVCSSDRLGKAYDQYSFKLLPFMGRVVARDEDSYRYLAESIRMHPDQQTLKGMMENAGLERVQVYNLSGGIVAVHRGSPRE